MSSSEILESLNQTDKLVSGKGFTWKMDFPSYEGFNHMYSLCKSASTVLGDDKYDNWIARLLQECEEGSESEIILYQKKIYFSIIKNSSFSSKLCTDYYPDFVNRFVECFKYGPLKIILSAYDFIPFHCLNDNTVFKAFQILQWRMEVLRRYKVVRELEKEYINGGELFTHYKQKDDFYWRLTGKKVNILLRELKRFFGRNPDLELVTEILLNPSNGNIIWLGRTESLAYLFYKLLKERYIGNEYWASVISRNMIFISKRGTLITSQNLNTSLHRIKGKEESEILLSKEIQRIEIAFSAFKKKKALKSR